MLRRTRQPRVRALISRALVLPLTGLLFLALPSGFSLLQSGTQVTEAAAATGGLAHAATRYLLPVRYAAWARALLSNASSPGVPVELRIPVLGLDTDTAPVGLIGGNLAMPAGPRQVGWYNGGPRPGLPGNAVIDGHIDLATGAGIFYNLHNLHHGDLIYLRDSLNVERAFRVTELVSYPLANAPLERIFGTSQAAHLNLITCSGTWLPRQQTYNRRLVVYTTLVGTAVA